MKRAQSLQSTGDVAGAEVVLREVLTIQTDNLAAHAQLGKLLVTSEQFEEAETHLTAACKLADNPQPFCELALFHERHGRAEEAHRLYNALHGTGRADLRAFSEEGLKRLAARSGSSKNAGRAD